MGRWVRRQREVVTDCAVSLMSGRGLYSSTLTLAVSLLRGTSAAIITAAHRPIRAQLCTSASQESHASGRGMTNYQTPWEQKLLLCLQATNNPPPPPPLLPEHIKTLSDDVSIFLLTDVHTTVLCSIKDDPIASVALAAAVFSFCSPNT